MYKIYNILLLLLQYFGFVFKSNIIFNSYNNYDNNGVDNSLMIDKLFHYSIYKGTIKSKVKNYFNKILENI